MTNIASAITHYIVITANRKITQRTFKTEAAALKFARAQVGKADSFRWVQVDKVATFTLKDGTFGGTTTITIATLE